MRIRGATQASEAGAASLRFFRFSRRFPAAPWDDKALVRNELFGAERLELHAASLAAAQPVIGRPPAVLSLHARLDNNASVLLAAYRENAKELENGRRVVPAAEWLLDNYHLVEEQIREIRDDLPPGFYRQLPRLTQGPFAGYPRVFGLTWAFVAHTDSNLDPDILARFIRAYQRVQPLTIGELWAVAITLRIVLIENLRRLAEQISVARVARAQADTLANRLVLPGGLGPRSSQIRWPALPSRCPSPSLRNSRSGCATRIREPRRQSGGWRIGLNCRALR